MLKCINELKQCSANTKPIKQFLFNRRINSNSLIYLMLLILFLGTYSTLGVSNLSPYISFIILIAFASPSFTKSLLFDERILTFFCLYLMSLILILYFSLVNGTQLIPFLSGMDNFLRNIFLFMIGFYFGKKKIIGRILFIVAVVNLFLSILQFVNPELVKRIFMIWYPSSLKQLQAINMYRAVGTFASPAGFGYFALLSLHFSFMGYFQKNTTTASFKNNLYRISLVMISIIIGTLSASKTFFFGSVMLISGLYFARFFKKDERQRYRKKIFHPRHLIIYALLILSIVFFFSSLFVTTESVQRSWFYISNQLKKPFSSSVYARYGYFLTDLEKMIYKIFPYGTGFLKTGKNEEAFIGDSGFLVILLFGGIFAFVPYYLSIILLGLKNRFLFSLLFMALFVDFGRPAFWGTRSADLLWLLLGYYYMKE